MPSTTYEYALCCIMSSHRESGFLKALKKSEDPFNYEMHLLREQSLMIANWISLFTSEELGITGHGYFGVTYFKPDHVTKTVEIVFAHRGTCFDIEQIGNVLADVGIALEQEPEILKDAAFLYIDKIFKCFARSDTNDGLYCHGYEITKITHTGFSLGGFIAGASVALHDKDFDETYAVTFDAPGIGALDFDRQQCAERIINYVTIPNVVNTCNEHVGEVRMLTAYASLLTTQSKRKADAFTVSFKNFKLFSTENLSAIPSLADVFISHDLDTLISHIQSKDLSGHMPFGEPQYKSVYKWPVATNEPIFSKQKPDLLAVPSKGNYLEYADAMLRIGSVAFAAYKKNALPALPLFIWRHTFTAEQGGLVGLKHNRDNTIFYSKSDYESFQLTTLMVVTLICNSSKPTTKTTHKNDTATAPKLSTASTTASAAQEKTPAKPVKKEGTSSSLTQSLSKAKILSSVPKTNNPNAATAASSTSKSKEKHVSFQSPRYQGPS